MKTPTLDHSALRNGLSYSPGLVLGTGRCGTTSAAKLISIQENGHGQHEGVYLPWKRDWDAFGEAMGEVHARGKRFVGVGFMWLRYAEAFREVYPESPIIALWRERDEVVESFIAKFGEVDWWRANGTRQSRLFPTFPPRWPLRKAIEAYWGLYMSKLRLLDQKIGVPGFHMSTLNDRPETILEALRVERPYTIPDRPVHLCKRDDRGRGDY